LGENVEGRAGIGRGRLQSAFALPFHVYGHSPRSASISIGIALSDATPRSPRRSPQ
jgi:hypothetical protein